MIGLHVHCACAHHPHRQLCRRSPRRLRRQSGREGAVLFALPLYGVDTSHLQLLRSLLGASCAAYESSVVHRVGMGGWEGGRAGGYVGAGVWGWRRRLPCQSQEIAIEEYTTGRPTSQSVIVPFLQIIKVRICRSRGKLVSTMRTRRTHGYDHTGKRNKIYRAYYTFENIQYARRNYI